MSHKLDYMMCASGDADVDVASANVLGATDNDDDDVVNRAATLALIGDSEANGVSKTNHQQQLMQHQQPIDSSTAADMADLFDKLTNCLPQMDTRANVSTGSLSHSSSSNLDESSSGVHQSADAMACVHETTDTTEATSTIATSSSMQQVGFH